MRMGFIREMSKIRIGESTRGKEYVYTNLSQPSGRSELEVNIF